MDNKIKIGMIVLDVEFFILSAVAFICSSFLNNKSDYNSYMICAVLNLVLGSSLLAYCIFNSIKQNKKLKKAKELYK